MGAFLSIDETRQVLFERFEGVITDEVLLARYLQALEWNAIHQYHVGITDFTPIAGMEVTAKAVRRIASYPPIIPNDDRRKVVVVAPQDEAFGMVRMFGMLGSATRDRVDVVRTMAEAYQVVGVESLELRPVVEW